MRAGFIFVALLSAASAQTVSFDFDTAAPSLSTGLSLPLEQTAGSLTARFSSPRGQVFSIQSDSSTGWKMPPFSGRYLYDNDQTRDTLEIRFSRPLTAITLHFATADFEIEVPTIVELTAYLDSPASTPIGKAAANGRYGTGATMPMGTLSFTSPAPFNLVRLVTLPKTNGSTVFFTDNITVTPAAPGFTSVSAASYSTGSLAPGAIAAGYGTALFTGPPQTVSLTITDALGAAHPASVIYASPTQINYLIPDAASPGTAEVAIRDAGRLSSTGGLHLARVAPGLFTANFDGKGAPAAAVISVSPDLTQTALPVALCPAGPGSCQPAPIPFAPGARLFLILYGTGLRNRTALSSVAATIAGFNAPVLYAGPQSQYPGLDQVNIEIPASLAGRGDADLLLTIDGTSANPVRINIK